jgi:cytochrome b561
MQVQDRYPAAMRLLHWTRAGLILGLILLGWVMTTLPESTVARFEWFYPVHKQFGVLAFLVGVIALFVRVRSAVPRHPAGLARWETTLSSVVQYAMLALAIIVPLMGYAMSSTYSHSDGVPFFLFHLPELLAKNDQASAVFAWLHEKLAYTLLALVVLHVAGVLKHRFLDRGRDTDVLPRML